MSNDLRLRKKEQPNAQLFFSEAEKATIVKTVASGLTAPQVSVFFYTCQALGLNPILNEISAITFKNRDSEEKTLSIQVMRDGFLTIAHRSGKFAGLESGVYEKGDVKTGGVVASERTGWARAYHKDFKVPVYQEAEFSEYDNSYRNALWKTKPKTMIKKVAESMALRKAFNVSGVYAPEEMEREISVAVEAKPVTAQTDDDEPIKDEQVETIRSLETKNGVEKFDLTDMNRGSARKYIDHLLKGKKS